MRKILNEKESMKKQVCKKLLPKKENPKKMHKKNKKCLNKVEKFYKQMRQGPYSISKVCHQYLYKSNVKQGESVKPNGSIYNIPLK